MNPAPGIKNLITDIPGIQVGHAEDNKIGTGVTVITGDKPFSAAVDVRGVRVNVLSSSNISIEHVLVELTPKLIFILETGGREFKSPSNLEIKR